MRENKENGSVTSRKKVVITSLGPYYSRIGEIELAELRAAAPDIDFVATESRERILIEVVDADGIIGVVDAGTLKAARKLKWLQTHWAGMETTLTPEVRNSPLVITNCKRAQGPEIGDHAFALLLAFTRELYRIIPRRCEERWPSREYHPIELQGKKAVIIGFGTLGTAIASRAKAFGMYVTAIDVQEIPPSPLLDQWHPPDRLDYVLPEADAVFVAAPSTDQSAGMMGARQFAAMKRTAYLIVVSRGRLYDMDALVEAIRTKRIAGAGLDVTDPAEPLPKGHPLWKFDNVIITPHIAGRSEGEHARYMAIFKENVVRFQNDEPLVNVVDKQKGY
ncbi:MAG: D-2-hydroxyacid dehydrogenase [Bryobacteraceae bacterium]